MVFSQPKTEHDNRLRLEMMGKENEQIKKKETDEMCHFK